MRLLYVIGCWMVLFPGYAYAASPGYEARLDEVLHEYKQIQAAPDVGQLVRLDEKVRGLIAAMQSEHRQSVRWDNKYAVIGVDQGDGLLVYTGKLLAEAHRLNPDSPYRERTFCSRIIHHDSWGAMPDFGSINTYLKEFPEGYCARDAERNLATFYSDLLAVLVELQDPTYEKDYKYDCFAPYINKQPYKQQEQRARTLAITHFKRVLASKNMRKSAYWSDEDVRNEINKLINGDEFHGWFWCTD